jgi:hypothetical protein
LVDDEHWRIIIRQRRTTYFENLMDICAFRTLIEEPYDGEGST